LSKNAAPENPGTKVLAPTLYCRGTLFIKYLKRNNLFVKKRLFFSGFIFQVPDAY
jgi:hypothetical protein